MGGAQPRGSQLWGSRLTVSELMRPPVELRPPRLSPPIVLAFFPEMSWNFRKCPRILLQKKKWALLDFSVFVLDFAGIVPGNVPRPGHVLDFSWIGLVSEFPRDFPEMSRTCPGHFAGKSIVVFIECLGMS